MAGVIFFIFAFVLATRTISPTHLATEPRKDSKADLEEPSPVPMNLSPLPSPSPLFLLYQLLPLALLSTLWGLAASLPLPAPFDALSIWLYATLTKCNVEEASPSDLSQYKTVSQFFTRRLRPGLRPICPSSALVSPADGSLTFSGPVEGAYLQQVKGVRYSLTAFLGQDLPSTRRLCQAVVYLSPSDYHRFHSPADWVLEKRRHFPGALCSVSPAVVRAFPGLFHINERVAFLGHWAHGFMAVVAVGATNVGSIVADFDPDLKTNQTARREYQHEVEYEKPIQFKKGDEFGHFNFGSTIVVIFEAPSDCEPRALEGIQRILVGEGLLSNSEIAMKFEN